MLRNLAWHTTDMLTRAQLSLVQALADTIGLSSDERCRILSLTRPEWLSWSDFLADGPLPVAPAVPDMLRRLAETAFNLSLQAERHEAAR